MHPPGGAPRPRVQPIRDYRGRVVRKKASSPESTRVGRLEIIGVGVAFLLLLATVVVIVAVQFRGGPPDDPRFVDGEPTLATGAASAGKAPVATPAPRPAATPLVVVREEVSPTPTSAPVATPTPAPRPTERTSRAKATPARPPTPAAAEEVDEVTPRPVGTGLVTVNTYPYSQVFIDGKSLGRTPLVGKEIRVGKHEVKLVFPTLGNEEVVETIFVEAGKEAKVVRRLTEGQ